MVEGLDLSLPKPKTHGQEKMVDLENRLTQLMSQMAAEFAKCLLTSAVDELECADEA